MARRCIVLASPRSLRSGSSSPTTLKKDLLQAAAGTRTAVPGAVACLQSAGTLLDWYPHVHLLVSWGLLTGWRLPPGMTRPPITPDLSAVLACAPRASRSAQAGRMLGEANQAQPIYWSCFDDLSVPDPAIA